jgi:hypothetical protein
VDDPVRARRAQITKLVNLGRRLGYSLFLISMIVFAIAFAIGFDSPTVPIMVFCLIAGSVVLAPAIVFGYGVKAAEREDRAAGK